MRKIWVDYSKTIGSELEKAFGRGGKAAGDMITAALEFDSQRSQAQDRYEQSTKSTADKEKLSLDINSARIKSYGDMADAAAGFFDKGSKGYQTLSAVSKVFHMAELAMATAKLVPMAIAAVLNQGNGDPYTAFGRMAAMAALVAGLGVAVSAGGGGGGGRSAAEQQKIDGTGTVFGNSTAKSDSINKSLERIQKNTYQDVNVSQGMLASLQNIEAAMTGLSNLVLRTTGVVDGSNLKTNVGVTPGSKGLSIAGGASAGAAMGSFFGPIGTVIGGILGGIVGAVSSLWGKTTKTVIDSGLQLGGSVRDLQAGRGYNQYASVDTTKKSWFGLSKKTTNSVVTQSLGSDLSNQFAMVFNNLETSLKAAAVGMGVGADQVTSALDKLVIGVSTASLKDLKGDELTQALNALVSKVMDQMAAAAFPAMDRFSKVGEGYAETVLRVAADYQTIDAVFLSFGKTFGLVGASSLDAREQLIELSGGLEKFTSQGAYFLDNFFTDAEKRAALGKQLAPTLTKYGLSANSTQAAFKSVVLGLNTTTKAGAEAYAALMAIAPAFKSMTEAVESERRDLQDQLDELTMSSTQLLAKQRAAIDESNRALFDQVQAAKTAKDSIDSSRDSLTTFMGNMKDFATSVRDAAKSLLLGDLSTLTPEEKYAEARRQYNNTLTAARAGDTKAQNEFASIQSQFLTISQAINGSDSQYTADFNAALAASQELATWADSQANIAQSSLDALNAQLAALAAANATLSQIAAAVQPSPTNTTGVGSPSYDELVFELRLLREQQAAAALEAKRQRDAAIAANLAGQQAAAEHVAGTVSQTIMDNNYAQQIGEGIIQ